MTERPVAKASRRLNRLLLTVVLGMALLISSAIIASAATPSSSPAASSPKSIVVSLYRAISAWNFGNAYSYIDPQGRPGPFHSWALNHTNTSHVTINAIHDPGYKISRSGKTYTCVGLRFTSYQTNGTATPYGGWYMTVAATAQHWRVFLPGSLIVSNGKEDSPSKSVCAKHI